MPPLNPFLAACSSTPLRTAMAGVTAHGVTVARSYAETKIESYEQRDGHARWAAPHPNSAGFITRESRTSKQRSKILMTFHYTDWFIRNLTGLS